MSSSVIGENRKIRAFISYSSKDSDFANRLAQALQGSDIEVLLDKKDLHYGEKWNDELTKFVKRADNFIFVVSKDSADSKWCSWELAEAERLKKRVVPVIAKDLNPRKLPPQLAALHLLSFVEPNIFADQSLKLVEALRTDLDWIQERTWIDEWATRWEARSRTRTLLLRKDELDRASAWMGKRPVGAAMLPITLDFFETSLLYKKRFKKIFFAVVFFVTYILVATIASGSFVYFGAPAKYKELFYVGFAATLASGIPLFVYYSRYFRKVRDFRLLGFALVISIWYALKMLGLIVGGMITIINP